MKKKVKKIPKYGFGTEFVDEWKNMSTSEKGGAITGAISAAAPGIGNALGIEQGKNAQIFNAIGAGLDAVPVFGKMAGDIARTVGAFAGEGGHVDQNTGEYTKSSGLTRLFGWGRSDDSVMQEANRVKGSILAKARTEDLKADYANQGINPAPNVLAAEGGIMRQPVDALVSKGELIYNPVTKKLSQVPGSKGKPNKADDVYAKLYEGDVVISNSPTMLMANGKTPALNLMGMVDKYSTGGTVKAREAIIKKVVNWQEANKTKPLQYAMYSGGTDNVKPYGYNKNLEAFEYWDKDKKEYKKEYLDWVNKLTEQDVKDIFNGNYGDMSTYKGVNTNYIPTVEEARKLMTDKKYGDWHKIGKAVVDKKIKTNAEPTVDDKVRVAMEHKILPGMREYATHFETKDGKYVMDNLYTQGLSMPELLHLPDPYGVIAANKTLRKLATKDKWNKVAEYLSDFTPFAAAVLKNYDYHSEPVFIGNRKYVPTYVSTDPTRRAIEDSYSLARYNQSNINPNTGAGMAYGLQAASNRAKSLADMYHWQTDAQNKLIAQNVGIHNDWEDTFAQARHIANTETSQNEGAAQQMKDSAIRDTLEFTQGVKNDKILADMMKPMFEYGTPNEAYKRIYKRRIV